MPPSVSRSRYVKWPKTYLRLASTSICDRKSITAILSSAVKPQGVLHEAAAISLIENGTIPVTVRRGRIVQKPCLKGKRSVEQLGECLLRIIANRNLDPLLLMTSREGRRESLSSAPLNHPVKVSAVQFRRGFVPALRFATFLKPPLCEDLVSAKRAGRQCSEQEYQAKGASHCR